RRRHTRFSRDWSSDVCSSDLLRRGRLLLADDMGLGKTTQAIAACHALFRAGRVQRGVLVVPASLKGQWLREWQATTNVPAAVVEIGRASCRVRGEVWG